MDYIGGKTLVLAYLSRVALLLDLEKLVITCKRLSLFVTHTIDFLGRSVLISSVPFKSLCAFILYLLNSNDVCHTFYLGKYLVMS